MNYTVVAEFIVQSESSSEIASALEIIKQWNPKWEPPLFMSDYSEAEQLAIAQVFPYSKFYLCDFHREQSWERWVKNHNHGLTKSEGEELLGRSINRIFNVRIRKLCNTVKLLPTVLLLLLERCVHRFWQPNTAQRQYYNRPIHFML